MAIKVRITSVTEVVMDEFDKGDIQEMANSLSSAGVRDIEGICQGAEVVGLTALPVFDEFDCLAKEEKEQTI